MRCERCGKEISPLRQLTDREFCGEECRRRGARASASELRDIEYHEDPFWETVKPAKVKGHRSASAPVLGILIGGMIVVGSWVFLAPADKAAVGGVSPLAVGTIDPRPVGEVVRETGSRPARWLEWMQAHLPGERPVRLGSEWARSLRNWEGGGLGWSVGEGALRPGRLRLWAPTLNTKDYDWQFVASIEKKGLGWVYRAKNSNTYYATRLVLTKPGEMNGASIVRYGQQANGRFAEAQLPLPVVLHKGQKYQISVVAAGDRFRTLVDGHVIDEWRDGRLKSGGVGLFTEEGEAASVEQVEFRERKGFLNGWLSAAFFLPPDVTF